MNKAIIIGNIVREPEYRSTNDGTPVCSFTVAVNRRYKNPNGEYDADYIGCVAWRNNADFVYKHFVKGQAIGVTGTLQTRNFEDKKGIKRYVTELIADEIDFIGRKENKGKKEEAAEVSLDDFVPADDAELPF